MRERLDPVTGQRRQQRALVVENDSEILAFMIELLTDAGYDVRGTDSINTFALLADWTPDVALIDLSMPVFNGADIASWLRTRFSEMRIVLYSGQPDTEMIGQLVHTVGADAWVAKPFDNDYLLKIVAGE